MRSPRFRKVTDDDLYAQTVCEQEYLNCPMGASVHYHCPNCGAVVGHGEHRTISGFSCERHGN